MMIKAFKKIVIFVMAMTMLIGAFALSGCDSISLDKYKETKSQALQDYADAKGIDNYSTDGWQEVCKALTDGKTAIENATNKSAVMAAFNGAKEIIDAVEVGGMNNFNAVIYDRALQWRNDEFYLENLTFGDYGVAYFEDKGDYLSVDETSPESRTFIIKSQDELENIFTEFPSGINFENEMILLYIFTQVANDLSYGISKVSMENKIVSIYFELFAPPTPWASMPIVRWIAVKLDKLDINTAEFVEAPIRVEASI